jgi:hypothetical protein
MKFKGLINSRYTQCCISLKKMFWNAVTQNLVGEGGLVILMQKMFWYAVPVSVLQRKNF